MNFINEGNIGAFAGWLVSEERASATVEKYVRDARMFAAWLNGVGATKDAAIEYKRQLSETRKASSVNASIAALNGFLRLWGGASI